MSALKPRAPGPALEVALMGGSTWKLAEQQPEHFTMIVFYRGLHCPVCKIYIRELEGKLNEFAARGVDVIAISSDTHERAQQSCSEWGLTNLPIGYGFPVTRARDRGLFVSHARIAAMCSTRSISSSRTTIRREA